MARRKSRARLDVLQKCPTGISGLDEIADGGLPRGKPTLVCGGAGSGKTLLAMEFIVRHQDDHGDLRGAPQIGARRQDGDWLIWVKDNGIGMDTANSDQAFELFRRLHSHSKYGSCDLQEDHRAPRRTDRGRVRARQGLDLLVHAARAKIMLSLGTRGGIE